MGWPNRPRSNRRNRALQSREQPAFSAPLRILDAVIGLSDDNIVLILGDQQIAVDGVWSTVPFTCVGDPENVHVAGWYQVSVNGNQIMTATPSETPTNCIGIEFTGSVPAESTIAWIDTPLIRTASGGFLLGNDLTVRTAE